MKINIILLFILLKIEVSAQFFINNNALAINNSIITVNNMDFENRGDFSNTADLDIKGNYINYGTFSSDLLKSNRIYISLNWTNNSTFIPGKSRVILNGTNQSIGGISISKFNVFDLKGNIGDKKTLLNNIICIDTLYLNNIEFASNGFELKIMNGLSPIQRTAGFISSSSNGKVKMYFTSAYSGNFEVPLGFGINANQYKPLYLINPAKDSFDFTLNGNSPINEGMSPLLLQDSLCGINQNYYYRIKTYGSSLFYGITKSATESYYSKLAKWDGMQWQKISNSGNTNSLSFSNLSLNSQATQTNEYISQAQEMPFVNAGNDFYLETGKSAKINTKGYYPQGSTIFWNPSIDFSCSNCVSPLFTMGTPGVFTILVNNGAGCEAIDTINILIKKNYRNLIPTSFTPNGDLLNDKFGPVLLPGDKLAELEIFNRWGQKIYKGTQNWDGYYNNVPVMQGVYIYKLVILSNENGNIKRYLLDGEFTLLR